MKEGLFRRIMSGCLAAMLVACSSPSVEEGVPFSLASQRAANLSDVQYSGAEVLRLKFTAKKAPDLTGLKRRT